MRRRWVLITKTCSRWLRIASERAALSPEAALTIKARKSEVSNDVPVRKAKAVIGDRQKGHHRQEFDQRESGLGAPPQLETSASSSVPPSLPSRPERRNLEGPFLPGAWYL